MGVVADVILPGGRAALGYGERLLKDLKAGDFARMPQGVKTNHAAFCFGHLATYPDRVLEMIGRSDLARPDARFVELFSAGKECLDDPAETTYPPMEEIASRYRERYEVLLKALAEVPEGVFAQKNPNERMVERFPTLGAMVSFMVCGHCMMHHGQVSAWRRMMGYGSAM